MTPLEGYLVQGVTVLVFAFGMIIWLFRLKAKYQKQALDHVLVEFVREEGTSHKELIEVKDGYVTLKGSKKKDKQDKDYPVGSDATYQTEYPEGPWVPRFLKTTIRKMIFREDCWEPLYNRGNRLLSPAVLHNIRKEKFTEVGAQHSLLEAEAQSKLKGRLNPSTVYILLWVALFLIVAVGGFMYFQTAVLIDMIEKITYALGV